VQPGRILVDVGRDQVVGRQRAQEVEPEERDLGQDHALAGDRRSEDAIEGRDAVGGDHQDLVVADGIDVAHLAARNQREFGDRGLQYGLHKNRIPRDITRRTGWQGERVDG
jgi:hypothetical protein